MEILGIPSLMVAAMFIQCILKFYVNIKPFYNALFH